MTLHAAFPPDEYGSGSRPTPLVDAPAWLKAHASGHDERVTLTPSDRAFLESPPTYEEGRSLLPSPTPALPKPSTARRLLSRLLFVVIAGGASAVLGLAMLHYFSSELPIFM